MWKIEQIRKQLQQILFPLETNANGKIPSSVIKEMNVKIFIRKRHAQLTVNLGGVLLNLLVQIDTLLSLAETGPEMGPVSEMMTAVLIILWIIF